MKYFKIQELVDRKTFEEKGEESFSYFNKEALIALDDLREFFGKSIVVNNWASGGKLQWRGLRLPACKEFSEGSQHSVGNAFDCTIVGLTAAEARELILLHKNDKLLKRITRLEGNVRWLHFDLKPAVNRIRVFTA